MRPFTDLEMLRAHRMHEPQLRDRIGRLRHERRARTLGPRAVKLLHDSLDELERTRARIAEIESRLNPEPEMEGTPMTRKHDEIFVALAAPFGGGEIRHRTQGGRQLSYITARQVMNRLDDVLGPSNWWDDYSPSSHGWVCRLTIRLEDGQEITKVDAGGNAGMSDEGDDDKSGLSDAFKRAAVKFGVGRHLYGDGMPAYCRAALGLGQPRQDAQPARQDAQPARHEPREAAPAIRPAPAETPRGERHVAPRPESHSVPADDIPQGGGMRVSGRTFYGWVKDHDNDNPDAGLLKRVNAWGKQQRPELPYKMVEWTPEQVELALLQFGDEMGAKV